MTKMFDFATKDWETVGNPIPAKDGKIIVAGSWVMSTASGDVLFRVVCLIDNDKLFAEKFYAVDGSPQEQELDSLIEKWRA